MKTPAGNRKKTNVSLRKKILFSALTTVLFFAMLECALTLLGVAPQTNTEDPFVGFSGLLPLMEVSTNEQGEQILSTAQNKRHWFNRQSFPKAKSKGTKRIFLHGWIDNIWPSLLGFDFVSRLDARVSSSR